MLVKILNYDFKFDDERGSLVQLIHNGYNQVNYVLSEKGAERGSFHYHKLNNEVFFVISGKMTVTLEYNGEQETHTFGANDMFMIEKNIRHKFVFDERTQLIGFYDVGVELDDGSKDIISV